MTLRSAFTAAALTVLFTGGLAGAARSDTLEAIKAKGVLTVAVKADYPPFGFRDSTGQIVGIEADLAADMARRLGVRLQLEPVAASARLQFLEADKADVMIATMAVNEDRKKQAAVIEPFYFAAGVAVLARKTAGIKSGADLKGKVVCAIPDSYYGNDLRALTGQALAGLKSVAENEKALLAGSCAAFAHDDVVLMYKKKTLGKWADFEVVPLDIAPWPWAIALKSGEKDTAWGRFASDTVRDWHRSGFLAATEKTWLGENTKWPLDQQAAAQ